MQNAICAHCDPDMVSKVIKIFTDFKFLQGSGVHDGYCGDFCDRLYLHCKDEFYDPYADKSSSVPICKTDSMFCSKVSDHLTNGREFCDALGFPASKLDQPTNGKENDCYNGRSSVGVKHDRLEIDYDLLEKRDNIEVDEDSEPDA